MKFRKAAIAIMTIVSLVVIYVINGVLKIDSALLGTAVILAILVIGVGILAIIDRKRTRKLNESIYNSEDKKLATSLRRYLTKFADDKNVYRNDVLIAFEGFGGHLEMKPLYGVITKECVCICDKKNNFVHFYKGNLKEHISFAKFKEKIQRKGKTMMDVDRAARIGNGLGGLGGAAYSAAKAMEANANGGIDVTYSDKVDKFSIRMPKFEAEIQTLYVKGKHEYVRDVSDTIKKLTELLEE